MALIDVSLGIAEPRWPAQARLEAQRACSALAQVWKLRRLLLRILLQFEDFEVSEISAKGNKGVPVSLRLPKL